MNILHVDFRRAQAAQLDTPADLEMARQLFAPYLAIPLSREHEVALREIQDCQTQIGKLGERIRWLRLSLQTT